MMTKFHFPSKKLFSPHFDVLPKDMQFNNQKYRFDKNAIQQKCAEKEATISELQSHLKDFLRKHPQSDRKITREELAALQRELLAFNESANRFHDTYCKEYRMWIVQQNSRADEKRAFQENSRRVGDCARKTNQMRVDKILKDFELIRHSIDVIGHLRQESLFMEDNDSENLLREERMRQLRDEILILDQASKRPDIPS